MPHGFLLFQHSLVHVIDNLYMSANYSIDGFCGSVDHRGVNSMRQDGQNCSRKGWQKHTFKMLRIN